MPILVVIAWVCWAVRLAPAIRKNQCSTIGQKSSNLWNEQWRKSKILEKKRRRAKSREKS